MTSLNRLLNTDALREAEERERRKAEERFLNAMHNCNHVLQLMSGGGEPEDFQQHSPCLFCGHDKKETCPNGGIKKFGICPHYELRPGVPKELSDEMVNYLRKTPLSKRVSEVPHSAAGAVR